MPFSSAFFINVLYGMSRIQIHFLSDIYQVYSIMMESILLYTSDVYFYNLIFFQLSWQGLKYIECIFCIGLRPTLKKRNVLGVTLNHIWFLCSGEFEVLLHCYYSQVYSDLEW